jgi:hypothetical protein
MASFLYLTQNFLPALVNIEDIFHSMPLAMLIVCSLERGRAKYVSSFFVLFTSDSYN